MANQIVVKLSLMNDGRSWQPSGADNDPVEDVRGPRLMIAR